MHQCPPPANIPANILVGKTRAKIGGQRSRNIEALTQYILSRGEWKGGGKERNYIQAAAAGGTANNGSDANLTWQGGWSHPVETRFRFGITTLLY